MIAATSRPILLFALVCAALSGCVTGLRGAPARPFTSKNVEAGHYVGAVEVRKLIDAGDKSTRDNAINRLLAVIDVRYMEFRHNVVANRKHLGGGSGLLQLGATVAGGLTDSIGVKDNYLAFSTLLQGGEAIYDKNYLFERTLVTLVTQMDASRKERLAVIRNQMSKGVDEYTGQMALNDVIDYYQSGTLTGAVNAAQIAATDAKKAAEENLIEPEKQQNDSDKATGAPGEHVSPPTDG